MSPSPADQAAVMKEVLAALKTLEANQAQLSSSVDAISGRVNVLAGMKEVHDVAKTNTLLTSPVKDEPISGIDVSHIQEDVKIPESPSLPATQVVDETSPAGTSHARRPSTGTSRIILTYGRFRVSFIVRYIILMLA